jgi:hypothetical protein
MRASGTTGDEFDVHGDQRRPTLGITIAAAVAFGPAAAQALAIGAPEAAAKLAYVDPGSGSFILQALVAALAGVAVVINAYRRKIKQLLGIGEPERDDRAAETQPDDD